MRKTSWNFLEKTGWLGLIILIIAMAFPLIGFPILLIYIFIRDKWDKVDDKNKSAIKSTGFLILISIVIIGFPTATPY